MPRLPEKNLTARQVDLLKQPGKYAGGCGLYLEVKNGRQGGVSKRWFWRGSILGSRREISIGPATAISLREARDQAQLFQKIARSGADPKLERDKGKKRVPSFEDVARKCYEEAILPARGNGKHLRQWISTLECYVFPAIGKLPINSVRQEHIIGLISPIWISKHETASRTLQRIRRVYEWARPRSECEIGERRNPADDLKDSLPRISKSEQKHFAALPHEQLPALIKRLQRVEAMSALALRFTILNASRASEVRLAEWAEIDLESRVWTIPAKKMKGKTREHRVPLTDEAIIILRQVWGLSEILVFPSPIKKNTPISDGTMNNLLVRLGVPRSSATVHGFRSTFRDWAEETTDFAHEVKEAALAHTIPNKAEASYRRTDLFDKRRKLMEAWAQFTHSDG